MIDFLNLGNEEKSTLAGSEFDTFTVLSVHSFRCRCIKAKAKASESYIARLTGTKPDQARFTIIIVSGS